MTPLQIVISLFVLLSIISIVIVLSIQYDKEDEEKNKEKRNKVLQTTLIIIGSITSIGILIILYLKWYTLSLKKELEEHSHKYPAVFGQSSGSSEREDVEQKISEMKRKSYRRPSMSPPTTSEREEIEQKIESIRESFRKRQ
jgi:heme/copper-type cytochrome/quinol oxidase subunit 2